MALLCRVFDVSRSGYHAFRSRETYGPERLQDELRDDGFKAGVSHIKRLRKKLGLRCKQVRQFKVTTNSNHDLPVAENLLNQKFETTRPNETWVTDITYVRTGEGWLYLAGVKDIHTCELAGGALGHRMTTELVSAALVAAAAAKRPAPGLIHHSDRGSRYCARDYRKLLEQFGMKASMSRRGNCYERAACPWGTMPRWKVSGVRA